MTKEEVYGLIETHFRTNNNRLVTYMSRYLRHPSNAQDVVQETYHRCCKYWAGYDTEKDFEGWFKGILNNSIKRFFTQEMLQGMTKDMAVDTTSRVFDKIELDELMVVMNTYPDNHRTILKYYFLNELNSCEIAEIVPESAFNVRKVVQRFRNKVKETHGG